MSRRTRAELGTVLLRAFLTVTAVSAHAQRPCPARNPSRLGNLFSPVLLYLDAARCPVVVMPTRIRAFPTRGSSAVLSPGNARLEADWRAEISCVGDSSRCSGTVRISIQAATWDCVGGKPVRLTGCGVSELVAFVVRAEPPLRRPGRRGILVLGFSVPLYLVLPSAQASTSRAQGRRLSLFSTPL